MSAVQEVKSSLNFICPFCLTYYHNKVEIVCEYNRNSLTIPWQCHKCLNTGVWERVPRQPNMFIRACQAIKKAWD